MNSVAHLKRKTAFVVGHQGARLGGHVLGGLQPVLALLAAFDQVAETEVAFGRVVQISWELPDQNG